MRSQRWNRHTRRSRPLLKLCKRSSESCCNKRMKPNRSPFPPMRKGEPSSCPSLRRSAPGQKFDSNTSKHYSTIEQASSKWSLLQEGTFSREEFQYKQSHVGRNASHFCRSIRSG